MSRKRATATPVVPSPPETTIDVESPSLSPPPKYQKTLANNNLPSSPGNSADGVVENNRPTQTTNAKVGSTDMTPDPNDSLEEALCKLNDAYRGINRLHCAIDEVEAEEDRIFQEKLKQLEEERDSQKRKSEVDLENELRKFKRIRKEAVEECNGLVRHSSLDD